MKFRREVVEKTRLEVIDLLKQQLKPEFLNRIDEIVMFEPLTHEGHRADRRYSDEYSPQAADGKRHPSSTIRRRRESGSPAAGYDPLYGARPVKRTIQRYVVNDLSKRILAGDVNREHPIVIDADADGLTFKN